MKIVISDSACDITELDKSYENVIFKRVPLSITVENTNYIDTDDLDVDMMMQHFETYNGKTSSACPSPSAWVEAAKNCNEIIMVALSANLSGSYNSAMLAKDIIEEENPNAKVYVVNALSVSGKNALLAYKAAELLSQNIDFLDLCIKLEDYKSNIKTNFVLFSIDNLVKNGRVSKLVGMAANALNMSFVGEASEEGTLKMLHKCRGLTKSINAIVLEMKNNNYNNGKVIISHTVNELGSIKLKEKILETFPNANISIIKCSGLCSYYSERNGLIIGYEI